MTREEELEKALRAYMLAQGRMRDGQVTDFVGDTECVTHHHACDCREARFKRMEEGLRDILDYDYPPLLFTTHEDILKSIASAALGDEG